MYNSDIDTVTYIHIYKYTDARPSMPSHRYTHVFKNPSIRACTRVWLQPNADGAADARVRVRIWASVHASMHERRCRRTFVQTAIPHPPARPRTRTRSRRHGFYICTHTYTYGLTHTHIYVSLVIARVRAAPDARSHAHTHTHIRADMYSTYAYEPAHTNITVHGDRHLGVARVRAASPTRARRDTLAWILQVHTNA